MKNFYVEHEKEMNDLGINGETNIYEAPLIAMINLLKRVKEVEKKLHDLQR